MMQNFRAGFRLTLSALALGAVVSLAPGALASETFPAAVQQALGTCLPQCTLCHATLAGGPGNLNDGFGTTIQTHVIVGNPASIPNALGALQAAECVTAAGTTPGPCDSDGDGVGDVDELRDRRDPNVAGVGALCDGPVYGCGARVASGTPDFDWVSLMMAGAAALTLIHSARRMRKQG